MAMREGGALTPPTIFMGPCPWKLRGERKAEGEMRRFLGNLKMTYKVLIAPLIVLIFLVLLSFMSYQGLRSQKEAKTFFLRAMTKHAWN